MADMVKREYALNVADLTYFPPHIAPFLLPQDVVQNRVLVDAEPGRVDGSALVLETDEDRAIAIIRLLRHMAYKSGVKHPLRAYVRKAGTKTWKRVR
jgi:hypothetical protein